MYIHSRIYNKIVPFVILSPALGSIYRDRASQESQRTKPAIYHTHAERTRISFRINLCSCTHSYSRAHKTYKSRNSRDSSLHGCISRASFWLYTLGIYHSIRSDM